MSTIAIPPFNFDPDEFDLVLVTCSDIHGIARGRFVFRDSFTGVVKHGVGMTKASLFSGVRGEIPEELEDLRDEGWTSGAIVPDITTLAPMSWLSKCDWKIGHVLCDLHSSQGEMDTFEPREMVRAQLRALESVGYTVVTSAVTTCAIFPKGSKTDPVVAKGNQLSPMLLDLLTHALRESGITIDNVDLGTEPGRLQISLKEQAALSLADNLHRLRQGVRSFCARMGYDVTFMTRPVPSMARGSTSYTWRLLDNQSNDAFPQQDAPGQLSTVGRHWLAGQLTHHAALTALARPTVNCYVDQGQGEEEEVKASWTTHQDDRTPRFVLQQSGNSLTLQDRLPSSASSPYNVVAAVVAAGLEGIVNKMELQPPSPQTNHATTDTPNSLKEALKCLDQDEPMKSRLGPQFLKRFIYLKTDFEIKAAMDASVKTTESRYNDSPLAVDRNIYFWSL